MPTDKLPSDSEAIVDGASRQAITDHFSELVTSGLKGCWLENGNRYRENASDVFEKDCDANPAAINSKELSGYIAASAPTHLIDGWSFYARASEALLRGDSSTAIHLGYYAELRAAMSILASDGIGVFNKIHPVIESTNKFSLLPGIDRWDGKKSKFEKAKKPGTHQVVWPLLEYWSTTQKASNLINNSICIENATLSEWIMALGLKSPSSAIAKDCFKKWGIDLANLDEDHKIRNAVSYRPSHLRSLTDPSAANVLNFVCESWRAFQPDSHGRFAELERQILKHSLRLAGLGNKTDNNIEKTLEENLQLSSTKSESYAKALLNDSESLLIAYSSVTPPDMTLPSYPLEVLARASLLLFIATSSVRDHLSQAGFKNLDFFAHRLISNRLCRSNILTSDYTDLWGDIEASIDATVDWSKINGATGSLCEWRVANLEEAHQLPAFELAAIWGMAA